MKTTLKIQNLKCGGCANTIVTSLSKLPEIKDVQVNVETSSISFDSKNQEALDRLKNTLSKIGYPLIGEQNSLTTKAKSYVSCAIGRVKNN